VEAGLCIRLYDEGDYLTRLRYTAPEIQRSNLAEVILRMLYLGLGDVQQFPFLDPPTPAAIRMASPYFRNWERWTTTAN